MKLRLEIGAVVAALIVGVLVVPATSGAVKATLLSISTCDLGQ